MPLAAAEPEDTSKRPWIMSAVCPEGDPLKGNLVRSHWWPLMCVYVFVCLSKPILLTALSTVMWHGEGSPLAKLSLQTEFQEFDF